MASLTGRSTAPHHGLSHRKVDSAAFGLFTKDVALALGTEIDYWAVAAGRMGLGRRRAPLARDPTFCGTCR
jgi:hypothetical protein